VRGGVGAGACRTVTALGPVVDPSAVVTAHHTHSTIFPLCCQSPDLRAADPISGCLQQPVGDREVNSRRIRASHDSGALVTSAETV